MSAHTAKFEYFDVEFKGEVEPSVDVTCVNCGEHVMKQAVVLSCQHLRQHNASDKEDITQPQSESTEPCYYTYTTSRSPVCAVCQSQLTQLSTLLEKEAARDREITEKTDADQNNAAKQDGSKITFKTSPDETRPSDSPSTSPQAAEPPTAIRSYDAEICRLSGLLQVIITQVLHIPTDSQGRPIDPFPERLDTAISLELSGFHISCQMCNEQQPLDHNLKQHCDKHHVKCEKCHQFIVSPSTNTSEYTATLEAHISSECPTPCRYCKTQIPRHKLQQHFITCEKRESTCLKCSDPLRGDQLFEHYMNHGSETVTCTNCDSAVQSGLFPCHIRHYCPPAVVCPHCPEQCGTDWIHHLQENHSAAFTQLCLGNSSNPQEEYISGLLRSCSVGSMPNRHQVLPIQETGQGQGQGHYPCGSAVTTDPLEDLAFRVALIENVTYEGSFIWKIPEFSKRWQNAVSGKYTSIFSLPFYTSRTGYKMCLRMYINGDGIGKDHYLSLFVVLMKGEYDNLLQWPFKEHTITFAILDQSGAGDHIVDRFETDGSSTSFHRPRADMNVASGCPKMAHHHVVFGKGKRPEPTHYLQHDTLFIQVQVDTSKIPPTGLN